LNKELGGKRIRGGCSELGSHLVVILGVVEASVVLLLEMLVRSEFAEESEKHVQRLNDRLIILQLVHWDVHHRHH